MSFETVQDIVQFIKDEDVKFVDIRFTDVPGTEHHFSIPAEEFTVEDAESGLAFDGSSIRGFTTIDESDMTLLPDPATAHIDPFRTAKTLNIKFFVHDPFTFEPFSRDPRNIARKAEEYLQSTGIADTCNFGAEAEFYLFDSVRFGTDVQHGFYEVDSDEGWWNRDSETNFDGTPNTGYKTRLKGGYFPTAPYDKHGEVRDAMVENLQKVGFQIERFHHEVGDECLVLELLLQQQILLALLELARGAGGAGGGERDDAAPVDVDVHEGVTGDPCAREPHRRHGSGSAESREIVRKS
mgnify:CR=1 FL=1